MHESPPREAKSQRVHAQLQDLLHWTWSSLLQLGRYLEDLSTEWSRAAEAEPPARAFSKTSLEEHLLLVTLRNLIHAHDRSSRQLPRLPVDDVTLRALRLLRDAYEHWPTERPAFARGLKRDKGAISELARLNPHARPYMVTLTQEGPVLGGVVQLIDLRDSLEKFEAALLSFDRDAGISPPH